MDRKELVPIIREIGLLTAQMVNTYFKGWEEHEVRSWLEENGLSHSTPIEHYEAGTTIKHYYSVEGKLPMAITHGLHWYRDQVKEVLTKYPVVTATMINRIFFGQGFAEIRSWLEENGLDPNMYLELSSTEIAILVLDPDNPGILMQIRNAPDFGKVGFWGGRTKVGETPEQCAIRELQREVGIDVGLSAKHLHSANTHTHLYGNGNKVIFHTNRYLSEIGEIPAVKINKESLGVILIKEDSESILSHQREWVREILKSHNIAK